MSAEIDAEFSRFNRLPTQYKGVCKYRMHRSRVVYEACLTDNRLLKRVSNNLNFSTSSILRATFDNIHDAAKQYDIWRIMLGLSPVNVLKRKDDVKPNVR